MGMGVMNKLFEGYSYITGKTEGLTMDKKDPSFQSEEKSYDNFDVYF